MPTVLQQLNTEMASLVENVERSLVQVRSGGSGSGAGTIWHPEGLIVTNAHVVQRSPLSVNFADGRTLPARLLAYDADRDLAALVVSTSGLPTIKPGDSRSLKPGQWVLALGHPWGIRGSVTAGVVIGTQLKWPMMPRLRGDWIAVGLQLRPGNSGGPLVDVHGRLVGINTMITGPDVGMAVPVHVVKAFLHERLGSQRAVA